METRLRTYSAPRLLFAVLVALGLAGGSQPASAQQRLPAFVDLTHDQTPIRNQGNRRTCFIHSVTAGMEAALKRAGNGDVDLSEDAFMYFVKLFWMGDDPIKTAGACENQVGGCDGGNGPECLHYLAGGLAIPEESAGWPDGHNYKIPKHNDAYWSSQFNVDSWSLSPRQLHGHVVPRAPQCHRHQRP